MLPPCCHLLRGPGTGVANLPPLAPFRRGKRRSHYILLEQIERCGKKNHILHKERNRLNVFPIPLPPLRDRVGDVPLLVNFLVGRFAARVGLRIDSVGKATMERLSHYSWPGNVRELENVLERAVILSNGPTLELDPEVFASVTATRAANDGPSRPSSSASDGPGAPGVGPTAPLESLESNTRNHILTALEKSGWV